jgi:RNA polymerase sigma-70 factor (ECF subfamily)
MSPDPTEETADEALLERFRRDTQGEAGRRAAGALLGRYRGRVYTWCLRMVKNHDDALDLSQTVLLKAWRALPAMDSRSRFASWLFTITRNECLTALRPRTLRADPSVDPAWVLVDHEDPLWRLETREQEETIETLMREVLTPTEQDALWLRCFEGIPVPDITRMLKLETASGARGVLQSAREKLRRALAKKGGVS